MHNIEKSGFHKGEYVGYGGGEVYRITRSNSSYGNWIARNQKSPNDQFFAMTLLAMSKKLDELNVKKNPAKRKTTARKKPRTPAQRAATARMLAANKARRSPAQKAARKRKNTVKGYYPNPQKAIPRKPRKVTAFEKYSGGLKNTRYRGRDRLIKDADLAKFALETQRGSRWVTLARFTSKAAAVEYGRALQRKYKRGIFRVEW